MRLLKNILITTATTILFIGCARDNAVAMNLYNPSVNQTEETSAISIEITQDMIDKARRDLEESGQL